MSYNWKKNDWPHFRFDLAKIRDAIDEFEERLRISGREFNSLPEKTRHETILDMMVTEATKKPTTKL